MLNSQAEAVYCAEESPVAVFHGYCETGHQLRRLSIYLDSITEFVHRPLPSEVYLLSQANLRS